MASILPIPAPPRTPTPPPEDQYQPHGDHISGLGLEGFLNSPVTSGFNPNSLSPMDENFPGRRYGSTLAMGPPPPPPLNPLSPTDSNSLYSPMSLDSAGTQTSMLIEDGKGVFQFQPTTLSKSPITKSVGIAISDLP